MKILGTLVFALLISFATFSQSKSVVFSVNINGQDINEGDKVGVRGSFAPLDWDKSILMSDDDGDGIYTVKIDFEDEPFHGMITYKFIIENEDEEIEDRWDLDRFGPEGNRWVELKAGVEYAALALFDEFDDKQRWLISEMHAMWTLGEEVLYLNEQGVSCQEIGKRFSEDGDWEWVNSAYDFWRGYEWASQSYPLFKFEVLEGNEDLVRVQTNDPIKDLEDWWGLEEDNEINAERIHCVLDEMYKVSARKKGLSFEVEENDQGRLITIKKAE
jgi:hypothetical protein